MGKPPVKNFKFVGLIIQDFVGLVNEEEGRKKYPSGTFFNFMSYADGAQEGFRGEALL